MFDLDPYIRTLNSPVAEPTLPEAQTPSSMLKTARWHAGLSQADVAQRAATSQQAVARYEKGVTTPSLDNLRRLLAACGMHLTLSVTPEPGLIDKPTRDLLQRPPLARLPEEFVQFLSDVVPVLHALGLPALVADKAAARLRGALVRVFDIELWVDESDVDVPALERGLEEAGLFLWPAKLGPEPVPTEVGPPSRPRLDRLEGGLRGRELRIRGMRHFADHVGRAAPLDTPFGRLLVTSVAATALYWPTRDRDHLALQRAERLREELAGPGPL